ncbi:Uncharacterised protein [Mycobacteroides abscessus subsp. abscessus]|uniref:hypothetical protein n=1 Tax=Mycobacteroides abscessus TaxID=36809 RepID=UPI0005E51F2D|nr:hypothetical protein [Mycobacteroides abscessus]MDM2320542.1 hypothetical protein [Mycobacteroides abscessus]MDM2322535.1 hypothetical protein [Mycobacteroides abscessus]MDM2326991.1 hypothetical protein [Mycobacteroides abscessus]MDM2331722.1 hypothetical protein [Mycobacteroides abscessus]MDM2337948.1 hypothetical protein [Mycobacteroides abscessus]
MWRTAAITAICAALGISASACATSNQEWHRDCTVLSKDTLYDTSGSNGHTSTTRKNRLSTSCGAFSVDDAWEVGSFNSWDLWARLEQGKVYDLKTGGYRNGFMGMFPVVLEIKGPK